MNFSFIGRMIDLASSSFKQINRGNNQPYMNPNIQNPHPYMMQNNGMNFNPLINPNINPKMNSYPHMNMNGLPNPYMNRPIQPNQLNPNSFRPVPYQYFDQIKSFLFRQF